MNPHHPIHPPKSSLKRHSATRHWKDIYGQFSYFSSFFAIQAPSCTPLIGLSHEHRSYYPLNSLSPNHIHAILWRLWKQKVLFCCNARAYAHARSPKWGLPSPEKEGSPNTFIPSWVFLNFALHRNSILKVQGCIVPSIRADPILSKVWNRRLGWRTTSELGCKKFHYEENLKFNILHSQRYTFYIRQTRTADYKLVAKTQSLSTFNISSNQHSTFQAC